MKVAGLAGADDKTKRLEAEKELLELRCQLGAMALADLIRAIDDAQARGNTQRVDESEVEEARAALELCRSTFRWTKTRVECSSHTTAWTAGS